MNYRRAKQLVQNWYPAAHLVITHSIKPKAGKNGGDSYNRDFYIADGYTDSGAPGIVLSGDACGKTIAKTWIAAAELIHPADTIAPAAKKNWPLRDAWVKKRAEREGRRAAQLKKTATGSRLATS